MNTNTPNAELSLNQQTAQRILNFRDDLKLDMSCYVSSEECNKYTLRPLINHPCGTSFCAAGELARLDGFPKEYYHISGHFDFQKYTSSLITDNFFKHFLFCGFCTNSREDLMARARYVLEHGEAPEAFVPRHYVDDTFIKGLIN